jgi:hypothetical protein
MMCVITKLLKAALRLSNRALILTQAMNNQNRN